MAFPIAHPAAILPLRRWCPRWLNFAALVIGAVAPDTGYAIHPALWHGLPWDFWSHRFNGIFYFSLPVGILMLLLLYGFRKPLVRLLPSPQKELLLRACDKTELNPAIILVSLFLGALSHLGWDSFTHPYGWFTVRSAWLQKDLFHIGQHHVEICQVLWYATSFIGIVGLMLSLKAWQQRNEPQASPTRGWANALIVAVLFIPVEIGHHFIHGAVGLLITAIATFVVFLYVLISLGAGSRNEKLEMP